MVDVSRLKLIHFSAVPIGALVSVEQTREPAMKPQGFWVSDESGEDGWRAWCQAESFHLDRLTVATRITLRPDHRVCWLATAWDIRRLTDAYGAWPAYLDEQPWTIKQGYAIDWARVAHDYQGVLITPYQWSLRLDPKVYWYYGWDCASGCIWDISAIAQMTPIPLEGNG